VPKLKLGAAFYGLIAIGLAFSVVAVLQHWDSYADVHGWPLAATAVLYALAALLFAIGAVTRRGLLADDGPWICRNGWLVLVGLTAVGAIVAFLSDQGLSPWPTGPAVFVPHFVRRMQEKYYDGVAEAEREIAAVRTGEPGEELPPAR
jgi:hypothetical protein